MTLITRFNGPDQHEWECHYFGRDSFHHHVMLIPAVDSPIARPEWWWGVEDPRQHDAAYWVGQVHRGLQLPAIEDAFVDGIGRAVWARQMAGHTGGPIIYSSMVIGVPNPEAKLLDLGEPVVPVIRQMLHDAWET